METTYVLEVMLDEDFPEELKSHYTEYKCNGMDSGIDLIIPESLYTFGRLTTINHKIKCQMCKYKGDIFMGYVSYWLVPRSSISKTRFRMANSIGLIDSGYRGNIMAKVDTVIQKDEIDQSPDITSGTRMFQIASGNLKPISQVKVVEKLSSTERGEGGFGSTGV